MRVVNKVSLNFYAHERKRAHKGYTIAKSFFNTAVSCLEQYLCHLPCSLNLSARSHRSHNAFVSADWLLAGVDHLTVF